MTRYTALITAVLVLGTIGSVALATDNPAMTEAVFYVR